MLDDAIETLFRTLEERPDKNTLLLWDELERGVKPTYSGLCLGRQAHESDKVRRVLPQDDSDKSKVTAEILNMLRPLDLENPVTAAFYVGQELEKDKEEQLIQSHLIKKREFPLLTFAYTGMYWTPEDDPEIVSLHKRLDEFYMTQAAA